MGGAVPHLLRENGRLGRPPEISEGLRLFEQRPGAVLPPDHTEVSALVGSQRL
jgi:hypothetical protein